MTNEDGDLGPKDSHIDPDLEDYEIVKAPMQFLKYPIIFLFFNRALQMKNGTTKTGISRMVIEA